MIVPDPSAPVASRGGDIGWDHLIGIMYCGVTNNGGIP